MRRPSRWMTAGSPAVWVLICVPCLAQAPIERRPPSTPPVWPQVAVDVTVTDGNDEPAKAVGASDLLVRMDGAPVDGAMLAPVDAEPESVCIVVDTSGSTYANRQLIKAELTQLIQSLPTEDEVCAIAFSSQPYLDVQIGPAAANHDRLLKWVGFLQASGGTALRDAITLASSQLETARYRSRAIVLISDGGENASRSSERDVRDALLAAGVPTMYALVNRAGQTGAEPGARNRLARLVEMTGGLEFPIRGEQDAQAAVDRMMRVMHGRYRLLFTASGATAAATEHTLQVELKKDLRRQKMNVAAPQIYGVRSGG